jgi:hypothetical protein
MPKFTKKLAAQKPAAPPAEPKAEAPKKCNAKDVGHTACKCGGPHCGDNASG